METSTPQLGSSLGDAYARSRFGLQQNRVDIGAQITNAIDFYAEVIS